MSICYLLDGETPPARKNGKSLPCVLLQAENAKLRELVRDMWEFGFGCNSGANDAWAWHERTDELEDRIRELGVDA